MQLPATFSLFSLSIPVTVIFFLVTVPLTYLILKWRTKGLYPEVIPRLHYQSIVIWAIAARLGFIALNHTFFLDNPSEILNIKDGGWMMSIGLIAVLVFLFVKTRAAPPLRKASLWAWLVASVFAFITYSYSSVAQIQDTKLPDVKLEAVTSIVGLNAFPEGSPPQTIALSAFKGKPVIINFWASWCGPCREEMSLLAKAQQDNPDLHFVFVNVDEDEETILEYFDDEGLSLFNVLQDNNSQMATALNVGMIPTTVMFDRTGKWKGYQIGVLTPLELQENIKSLKQK